MIVYCGHEYTLNNLKFLESDFFQNKILENAKKQILKDLDDKKRSWFLYKILFTEELLILFSNSSNKISIQT